MNASSFSFYSNIFGFIAGGISLLGFVVAVCRPHLPSNKIKTLETLLHETEGALKEAVETGLLVHEFIERVEDRLTGLKEQTCSLRARAYNATTLRRDYTELFSGTSIAIGSACQSLKKLRAEIITSSEERRHRLMVINSESHTALRVPSRNIETVAERPPILAPPAEIPRPHSCPPMLPAGKLCSVDLIEHNPFDDPSRTK